MKLKVWFSWSIEQPRQKRLLQVGEKCRKDVSSFLVCSGTKIQVTPLVKPTNGAQFTGCFGYRSCGNLLEEVYDRKRVHPHGVTLRWFNRETLINQRSIWRCCRRLADFIWISPLSAPSYYHPGPPPLCENCTVNKTEWEPNRTKRSWKPEFLLNVFPGKLSMNCGYCFKNQCLNKAGNINASTDIFQTIQDTVRTAGWLVSLMTIRSSSLIGTNNLLSAFKLCNISHCSADPRTACNSIFIKI
jgi:hypothetical protein